MAREGLLVIGYGNELRGDDSAGPVVADLVAECNLMNVRALAAPLLLPEMVFEMAHAQEVLFVDASLKCDRDQVRARRVRSSLSPTFSSCLCSPEMLVGLCLAVLNYEPHAWLIEVPAMQFDYAHELSAVTRRGVEAAVGLVCRWEWRREVAVAPGPVRLVQPL